MLVLMQKLVNPSMCAVAPQRLMTLVSLLNGEATCISFQGCAVLAWKLPYGLQLGNMTIFV